jgi:GxxExxY protein
MESPSSKMVSFRKQGIQGSFSEDYKEKANQLSNQIIGAAIDVHRGLGPGLLESAYEACLLHELSLRGLSSQRQVALPLEYKGAQLDCGYRLDLLVENLVIVEIKGLIQG